MHWKMFSSTPGLYPLEANSGRQTTYSKYPNQQLFMKIKNVSFILQKKSNEFFGQLNKSDFSFQKYSFWSLPYAYLNLDWLIVGLLHSLHPGLLFTVMPRIPFSSLLCYIPWFPHLSLVPWFTPLCCWSLSTRSTLGSFIRDYEVTHRIYRKTKE